MKLLDVEQQNLHGEKGVHQRNENQPDPTQQTRYMSLDDYYNEPFSAANNWKVTRKLETDLVYIGDLKNGRPDGHGALTSPEEFRYVGNWKDGDFSGLGTFTYSNGDKYESQWRNDNMEGEGTYLTREQNI